MHRHRLTTGSRADVIPDNMRMNRFLAAVAVVMMTLSCTEKNAFTVTSVSLGSHSGNYIAVLPANGEVDSYLVLIPGFGETAESVMDNTDLPAEAARAGIAVFIATLQDGVESYSFSAESQECLRGIVDDIRSRFDLEQANYCIGGFSMGGSAAVRYAEQVTDNHPSCVFAIDSPLDYERYRYSTERDVNVYRKGMDDSIYVQLLEDITPLVKDSPYLLSDATHSAIIPLKNMPVRYYIEPAEQWWLDNRRTDVLGLNILDATAFINDLRLIGNDRAELIVTSGKGYRNHGQTYHPHSWTIADTSDLIGWILRCHDDKGASHEGGSIPSR